MLIDTSITITYKCPSCGSFKFFSISLFELLQKQECCMGCHCGKSFIRVLKDSLKEYRVDIPCIGCGGKHVFALNMRELLMKDIKAFCCPETGVNQCFIGMDEEVRKKIDCLEEEFDALINRLGYDNYFKNTQVMFEVLNKVHDIAEQGNLVCECGNADIELLMLPDKIHLNCRRCAGSTSISASSNRDLKDVQIKQQILLLKESDPIGNQRPTSLMGNHDGK